MTSAQKRKARVQEANANGMGVAPELDEETTVNEQAQASTAEVDETVMPMEDAKTFLGMMFAVMLAVVGAVKWLFYSLWDSAKGGVVTVSDHFMTILTVAFIAATVIVGAVLFTMTSPVTVTGVLLAVANTTIQLSLVISAAFAAVMAVGLFLNRVYLKITGRYASAFDEFRAHTLKVAS